MFRLENLSYQYPGPVPALSKINLAIQKGEKWAVIGANGCGKSTLLQLMDGLRTPTEGSIFFEGEMLTESSFKKKEFLLSFRTKVGFLFQDSNVQLFSPTVREELLFGPRQLHMPESEINKRLQDTVALMDIDRLKERPPHTLSGGEKKRVAMGSLLMMNPEVLLLDEPMEGLDPRSQCFMAELLLTLHKAGKTLVLATHDLSLVDELNLKTAVFSESHELVAVGPAGQILKDKKLLLQVNLVHEHIHFHGEKVHSHVHTHSSGHQHG